MARHGKRLWRLEKDKQRYALRCWSLEPHEIKDHGEFRAVDHEDAIHRDQVSQAIARMSYMVNGPNRDVRWSIEWWNPNTHKLESILQGVSRYPKRAPAP
jgi:hypothetical protein